MWLFQRRDPLVRTNEIDRSLYLLQAADSRNKARNSVAQLLGPSLVAITAEDKSIDS